MNKPKLNTRYIAVTGMLSAIAFVLMYIDFSIPIMPVFIKLDRSELPALIGAFAYGPVCGILVCLIKNVLHMAISSTALVGEVANFLLGAIFVGVAGFIYKRKKNKKNAVIGSIAGAVLMGLACIPINYFITYPFYYKFMIPEEVVLSMYQEIWPAMENILQSLICFVTPIYEVEFPSNKVKPFPKEETVNFPLGAK